MEATTERIPANLAALGMLHLSVTIGVIRLIKALMANGDRPDGQKRHAGQIMDLSVAKHAGIDDEQRALLRRFVSNVLWDGESGVDMKASDERVSAVLAGDYSGIWEMVNVQLTKRGIAPVPPIAIDESDLVID